MYLLPILIIILIIIYLINTNTHSKFEQGSSKCSKSFDPDNRSDPLECNVNRFGICLKKPNEKYGKCISKYQEELIKINQQKCESDWNDTPITRDNLRASVKTIIDRDKMCPHTHPFCESVGKECINQERKDNLNRCQFSNDENVDNLEDKQKKCTKDRPLCRKRTDSDIGVCITEQQKNNLEQCSSDEHCNLKGLTNGYVCQKNKCIDGTHIKNLNENGCSKNYNE